MNNRATINRIFERLVQAPSTLDCSINDVLAACGMFVSAILTEGFDDPAARQDRADRFCRALQFCVNPSHHAGAQRH